MKLRRGNHIFVTFVGDHGPRHVHAYRDRRLVVKWDLENGLELEGKANRRLRKLIRELQREGRL